MSSGAALVVAPVVLLLPTIFALWRQEQIEDFTLDGEPPPVSWNARKQTIAEQQTGNTVVYSNYEPFIGSGEVVSSWGFAQRLVHKQPDGAAGWVRCAGPGGSASPRRRPARRYLARQVVSWGGDVVTTVYVHIAVQGRSLYLEVTSTTMAPCNERCRVVDVDGGTGPSAWLREVHLAG